MVPCKSAFTEQSSCPDFVNVSFSADVGTIRVLVPAGATVEYAVYYSEPVRCYALLVFLDDEYMGLHCGDRTGRAVFFERESDAVRLAGVRNALWGYASVCGDEVVA